MIQVSKNKKNKNLEVKDPKRILVDLVELIKLDGLKFSVQGEASMI